ncbi:MAG: GNAT family N-acetyltransferase [Planctomycetes bacterium]|nr:GNAT family N-acetyltransferase [Planctomycetota bacterium]
MRRVPLRGGGEVLVRPLGPEDGPALLAAFHRLSPVSRYRRFMARVDALAPATLRYLTCVDQRDHVALAAFEGDDVVGVARCIRLPGEPTVGEVAVTVADTHHGRGLGTALLGLLSLAARAQGFETFRAYVQQDNRPMLEIFEQLGGRVTERDDEEETVSLDVPIPDDLERLPDTPAGRAIRAVARDELAARHPPVSP